ncbi:MAG: hypothetical protein PHH64_02350, partial [Proteiniphilum sp.]|nr:hypothetical protein [Proteiniphilum sp.]MDD4158237.1 hypothetical protein [Proteiniphilum sp.]
EQIRPLYTLLYVLSKCVWKYSKDRFSSAFPEAFLSKAGAKIWRVFLPSKHIHGKKSIIFLFLPPIRNNKMISNFIRKRKKTTIFSQKRRLGKTGYFSLQKRWKPLPQKSGKGCEMALFFVLRDAAVNQPIRNGKGRKEAKCEKQCQEIRIFAKKIRE